MLAKMKQTVLDDQGQSLVEFTLVTLFIIVPVMVAIIDGSILFYKWVALTNAAREGARAGAIYHYIGTAPAVGEESDVLMVDDAREEVIKDAVDARIGPLVSVRWDSTDDWAVTYDPPWRCVIGELDKKCDGYDVYRNGSLVTVAITHTHNPFVGLVIGVQELDLTAAATMRIEPGLPMP